MNPVVYIYQAAPYIGSVVRYAHIQGVLESVEYEYDEEYVAVIGGKVIWLDKYASLEVLNG